MKNFIKMLNEKIEKEDLLTIGIKCGENNDLDAVIPESVIVDDKIHIKAGWRNINISRYCEFSYDEYEEEYIFRDKNITYYFS